MKKNKVLYQIKTLEKMIAQIFFRNQVIHPKVVMKNISNTTTPTQMQIMGYILEHIDEEIYQKDLEDVLKLRRATVSGVLQTMEKNKLIERITYEQDTRKKKIILNDDAKKIFLENKLKMEEIEKVIIEGITDEELDVFSMVIEKMKKNIEKI